MKKAEDAKAKLGAELAGKVRQSQGKNDHHFRLLRALQQEVQILEVWLEKAASDHVSPPNSATAADDRPNSAS